MTVDLAHVLIALAVVFVVNLMPAFGPPTWAVLVFFRFRYDLPIPLLVVGGAAAAAAGRWLLAVAFRKLGRYLKPERRADLEALGETISSSKAGWFASLGFFVVAPVPSAQLFEAAGLARVRLPPLVVAFFVGRLASYTIYVTAASAAKATITKVLEQGLGSPLSIAIQVAMIAALVAMVLIPWRKVIARISQRFEERAG